MAKDTAGLGSSVVATAIPLACRVGWHSWPAWAIGRRGKITDETGARIGYYHDQYRTCSRCGLAETRTVSNYT